MTQTFSGKVGSWVAQTKERTAAVFKESAQRTVSIIQTPVGEGGAMRVDTGFLRASLRGSLNGEVPPLSDNPDGRTVPYSAGQINLVIADAEVGDVITLAYGANYARFVENRFGFVRLGAQRWPQIVEQVAREARTRAAA